MKKVLIITYYYPPDNNGGVERPYRFAKYLPEYGYDPIVITTDAYGKMQGEKNVHRFWDLGAEKNQNKIGRGLLFFLKGLRKTIASIHLLSYDFFWYVNARTTIDKIVSQNKIDIIFSTYLPISTVLLGLHLKRKYKISLVVDFRDGLLFEGLEEFNIIQKFFAKRLEKRIVEDADFITTVSPPITEYFKEEYSIENVATIYNGFDDEELDVIGDNYQPKLGARPFLIKYFGRFGKSSRNCNPENFFRALSVLKEKGVIDKNSFNLVMFTDLLDSELSLIGEFRINDIVTINDIINRGDALREMRDCDFLLFHGDVQRTSVVSSKLMEYIFMDKPILGICRGNEAERIIRRTSTGVTTGFEVDEIIKGLKMALNYNVVDFNPNISEINKFKRRKLTRELANVLRMTLCVIGDSEQ